MVNSKEYLDLIEKVVGRTPEINFKTLKQLQSILREYYFNLASLENQSFPSTFAINAFIHEKYKFPDILKDLFNKFNFLVKQKETQIIIDIEFSVNIAKELIELIIIYISKNEIDIDKLNSIKNYFDSFYANKKEFRNLYNLICIRKISQSKKCCVYKFVDEFDNILEIKFKEPWHDINNYLRLNNRVNIIDLNLVSEYKYETSGRSLVVVEPDYLIDVTELAGSFYRSGSDYLINLIGKLKESENNKHLLLGKIVNYTFDKLIEEGSAEFENIFEQSLKLEPLSFYDLFNKDRSIYGELKYNLDLHFNNLKAFVNKSKFTQPIIEPSFISPTFGLQGRLDLADIKSDDISEVNIIEMKSGKAPNIKMTVRDDNNKQIVVGAWEQHIAQVTGYNLLID
jgi:DNA replication ATP-dependent helicase Dna2